MFLINGREPATEEYLRPMRVLGVHQRKGCNWVVEYCVDEHLEICQFERLRFCFVKMSECSCDDMLKLLMGT